MVPIVREWLTGIISGGGSGVVMLMLGVGVVCWAFGKTQGEGFTAGTTGATSGRPNAGANGSHASGSTGSSQGASAGPPPQPNASGYTQPNPGVPPKTSWQRASATGGNAGAKTSWEKAREETRKKEDERRKAEELKRRRDEAEKARQRDREKEAREKEAREREAREREKQAQDRIERERKEKKEKADREAAEAVAAAAAKEKEEQEKKAAREREREKERAKATTKRPPHASARTETDDDAYSFRPYDRPKKAVPKANSAASIYSDSSYTPSHSTARTTPLPPTRGPYATKDPDKIVIKGVYSFNNAFMRTPVSQLISGQGNVTNGLILRITTEGLFIDDDVRGVPQREWDIKAWTMKLAEVWCSHSIVGAFAILWPIHSAHPFPLFLATTLHRPLGVSRSRPSRKRVTRSRPKPVVSTVVEEPFFLWPFLILQHAVHSLVKVIPHSLFPR